MSNTTELQQTLFEVWSHEYRTGGVTERVPVRFVSRMSRRLHTAMSEELQRITRVVSIVPTDVDIILDSRACIRALRRAGIFNDG
jgi:hypothetical protein